LKPGARETARVARAPFVKWRGRAALLALALVAYANSFGLGLAQDAKVIVAQDTRIREATLNNGRLILTRNYWWPKSGDGLYRPVTTFSFLLNYAVLGGGANPAGYHAVNFLLHVLNVWLVYELAGLVLSRRQPAFFAAALWAVHPIGTEAVASVVGRADLLAAMAVLGGLLIYIKMATPAYRNRYLTAAAVFAIATAGVFAKENAAILVGVVALWELTFGEGISGMKRRWPVYAALAASLLILWGVRSAVLGPLPVSQPVYVDNPLRGSDFWTGRWTATKVIGLDLWLMLVPLALSCDRSFNQIPLSGWADPWAWIALLAVAAILGAAVALYRRNRLWFFLTGFLGIALLPTSNLIVPIGATIAERFLYLPSVAIAMALAALAYRWLKEPRAAAVLTVLAVLFVGRTLARNPAWKDDLALATSDVQTTPRSFRLHDMLGKALFEQDARGNIDRAIQEQEKSWDILAPLPPDRSSEYPPTFLGIYYSVKADLAGPAESRAWYEKSAAILEKAREISRVLEMSQDERQRASGRPLTTRPVFQELYFNLANAYLHLGRYQEAVDALRYGRGVDPGAPEAYDGLNVAFTAIGDPIRAVVALEEKAQIDGFQPATLGAIREAYQKMPDGACAFVQQSERWQFNTNCPRVKSDLCAAWSDLAGAYIDARQPEQAQSLSDAAAHRYGCPAGK
jgi:protein O-mannosyl-transferase